MLGWCGGGKGHGDGEMGEDEERWSVNTNLLLSFFGQPLPVRPSSSL